VVHARKFWRVAAAQRSNMRCLIAHFYGSCLHLVTNKKKIITDQCVAQTLQSVCCVYVFVC